MLVILYLQHDIHLTYPSNERISEKSITENSDTQKLGEYHVFSDCNMFCNSVFCWKLHNEIDSQTRHTISQYDFRDTKEGEKFDTVDFSHVSRMALRGGFMRPICPGTGLKAGPKTGFYPQERKIKYIRVSLFLFLNEEMSLHLTK